MNANFALTPFRNVLWWAPFLAGSISTRQMARCKFKHIVQALLLALPLLCSKQALAHGSVALSEDICLINIGFLPAHFTVFQPESRGNDEFCEDIPDVSRAVFVMEYQHDLLSEMSIDFRIIKDINNSGRYTSWEDVIAIEDLEAATVYYGESRIEPGGYYRASYEFDTKGTYIGVVTAEHPTEDRYYNAVFYFQVGGPDLGTLPLFAGMLIILQLGYWLSSGGLARFKQRYKKRMQATIGG